MNGEQVFDKLVQSVLRKEAYAEDLPVDNSGDSWVASTEEDWDSSDF